MIMFNFSLKPTHHDPLAEAELLHSESWEGHREGHHAPQAALLPGGREAPCLGCAPT